jgi:hypothetical protein
MSYTYRPWELEIFGGGELTGIAAKMAEAEGCLPFALGEIKIVASNEFESGHKYNKETKKFDLPIKRVIAKITFDPRKPMARETALSNAKLIIDAVNNFDVTATSSRKIRNENPELGVT